MGWFAIILLAAVPLQGAALRIGVLLPSDPAEAASLKQGIELVAEIARARGQAVEFLLSNAHGQWGTEGDEAARLVLDEKVAGLIAPRDRSITHLALQVSGRTATPIATLCPDSSATGTGTPWCVRVVPGTLDAARDLFTWACTNAPTAPRWTAVTPSGRAGSELMADLRAAATSGQVKVTSFVSHAGAPLQTAAAVARTDADGTILWIDRAAATVVARELRRLKPRVMVLLPGSLCGDPEFTQKFAQRFKSPPDATALGGADAAFALIDRCSGGTWPACGHDHAGATGTLKFDRSGNRLGLKFLQPLRLDSE